MFGVSRDHGFHCVKRHRGAPSRAPPHGAPTWVVTTSVAEFLAALTGVTAVAAGRSFGTPTAVMFGRDVGRVQLTLALSEVAMLSVSDGAVRTAATDATVDLVSATATSGANGRWSCDAGSCTEASPVGRSPGALPAGARRVAGGTGDWAQLAPDGHGLLDRHCEL